VRPLDFVQTRMGSIALVTETHPPGNGLPRQASISFIGPSQGEKSAWWDEDDLEVIDSLPRLLAAATLHPFGHGRADVETFFGPRPGPTS
jgi:hypothetical protein